MQRLVPGFRKVDDRKPAVTQANDRTIIDPHALIIRAAVSEGAGHPPDEIRLYSGVSAKDARYPAHDWLARKATSILTSRIITAF